MSATREYDHFIFTHKTSSGDYLFVYASDKFCFVGLIYPILESADKREAEIKYEDVVDNMGYDFPEETKCKCGKIFYDSDSIFGEEHEMYDETYSQSDKL